MAEVLQTAFRPESARSRERQAAPRFPFYLPVPGSPPTQYDRISKDPYVRDAYENGWTCVPVKIERCTTATVKKYLGLFSRKIWENLMEGAETLHIPSSEKRNDPVEVGLTNHTATYGIVIYDNHGKELSEDVVTTAFPAKQYRPLEDEKWLVEGFSSQEEISEALLPKHVAEQNREFPFGFDRLTTHSIPGGEQAGRDFLERMGIHDIWHDLCRLAGHTKSLPSIQVRNLENTKQVERQVHQIIHTTDNLSRDETIVGRFDRLNIPLRQWMKHPQEEHRTTLMHELGHLLTPLAPLEVSEGMTEFLLSHLSKREPYNTLPDVFGGGTPVQLFPGNTSEGFIVRGGTNTPNYMNNFHAVSGWGVSGAFAKAIQNEAQLRTLVACCQPKNPLHPGKHPDVNMWILEVDRHIPGFKTRFEKANGAAGQTLGKKIYWFSHATDRSSGMLVAYEMRRDRSVNIPLQLCITVGRENMKLYCDIPSGGLRVSPDNLHRILKTLGHPSLIPILRQGFRIAVGSPDQPDVWKNIGQEFRFSQEDHAEAMAG